jgi:hypothetical protein
MTDEELSPIATERALARAGSLIVTLMGEVEYWKLNATQEAESGNTKKESTTKKAK